MTNKDRIHNSLNNTNVKATFLIGEYGLGKSHAFESLMNELNRDFIEINLELAKSGNILNPFFYALNLENKAAIYEIKQKLGNIESKVFFISNTFANNELISIFKQVIQYRSHSTIPTKFVFEINGYDSDVFNSYADIFSLNECEYIIFEKANNDEIIEFINENVPKRLLSRIDQTKVVEKSMGNFSKCSNIIRFLDQKLSRDESIKLENDIEEILIDFELKNIESEIYDFLKITSLTTISKLIYPVILEEVYKIENVINKLIAASEKSTFIRPFDGSDEFYLFTSNLIIKKLQSALHPSEKAKLIKYLILWLESVAVNYKSDNSNQPTIGLIDIYEKLVSLNNEFDTRSSCGYYFQLFLEHRKQMTYHMAIYWYEKYWYACETCEAFDKYFECLYKVEEYKKCIKTYSLAYADIDDKEIKVKITIFYAKAFYQLGDPEKCLKILKSIKGTKNNIVQASILSLQSSTYDWLNKDKEKRKAYRKALARLEKDTSPKAIQQKLELDKKVSMVNDFAMVETQTILKNCFHQYKITADFTNMMQVAHNIGTNFIFLLDLPQAHEYLGISKKIMNQISSEKIYMNLNSLGILYAVSGKYVAAIKYFQSIDTKVIEPFSKYAVLLNLLMCKIKLNQIAISDINQIENELNAKENSSNRDLILQRRNVILLKALYYKHLNRTDLAMDFFKDALGYKKYRPDSYANSICSYNINRYKKHDFPNINYSNFFFLNDMYYCEIMFWG